MAEAFPAAFIVSVAAPWPCDFGGGRQWFSVQGIAEENRPERIDAAMPAFVETVARWQKEAGVGLDAVALIGFSQGGIMALESTRDRPAVAGRNDHLVLVLRDCGRQRRSDMQDVVAPRDGLAPAFITREVGSEEAQLPRRIDPALPWSWYALAYDEAGRGDWKSCLDMLSHIPNGEKFSHSASDLYYHARLGSGQAAQLEAAAKLIMSMVPPRSRVTA